MATVASSLSLQASVAWAQSKTNGTLQSTAQGPDLQTYRAAPDAATYTAIQVVEFTLAASGTVTYDLSSFVDLLAITQTITKVLGFLIKAKNTVSGGQLQLAPGAANAINFWLAGTTPTLTVSCGDPAGPGCAIMLADGVAQTVSGTHKNLLISNPGTQTITGSIAIICGA